ncbi:MAG: hypothetical protein QOH43_77, partial [Solirubrobacteraceae bacterium]|nr:hypothetical protein [Solirubrobacteraceae bacterium]
MALDAPGLRTSRFAMAHGQGVDDGRRLDHVYKARPVTLDRSDWWPVRPPANIHLALGFRCRCSAGLVREGRRGTA